uniref:guanylate cyclase n=1 Tax=Plectus sambesii TaxID=2011161 RepID=A0A914VCN9_9BILA
MDEQFDLQRPCIKFSWDGCMAHLNCNFQMESLYPIQKKIRDAITFKVNDQIEDKVEVPDNDNEEGVKEVDEESEVGEQPYLQLRGPIIYLKSCDCMIYLPTC